MNLPSFSVRCRSAVATKHAHCRGYEWVDLGNGYHDAPFTYEENALSFYQYLHDVGIRDLTVVTYTKE